MGESYYDLSPAQLDREAAERLRKHSIHVEFDTDYNVDSFIVPGQYSFNPIAHFSTCRKCFATVLGGTNDTTNLHAHRAWHQEQNA